MIEAGASIPRRNVERMLRNTALQVDPSDFRRMDLSVPGLGIWGGRPLFCDITFVSPVTGSGEASLGFLEVAGGANRHAHAQCHNRDYSDINPSGIARLLCLSVEVFGRWGDDSLDLLRRAVGARCSELPARIRAGTRQRLLRRWWGLLGLATQRVVAQAVLEDSASDLPRDLVEPAPLLSSLPEA